MKKILKYGLIIITVLITFCYFYFILPLWGIPFSAQRHGNPPLTPAWALECWLWEDDANTGAYVDELLEGYKKYDIPVRTILIDSPWSTRYNDFEVDTTKYPAPAKWFTNLQEKGYRTVLWMTSMVDSHSKDTKIENSEDWFQQAADNQFLIGNGSQIKWWKGKGGFIDYTDSSAMNWWKGLQKKVLDYGIDGWKLDGTATLFRGQVGPLPFFYQKASAGWLSTRQYMDLYYREEYKNGLEANPEFVTLGRSMDRWFHPEGFAPIDSAPVTWVGDQKHVWKSNEDTGQDNGKGKDIALEGIEGFESAIQSTLKSADLGYNIIGSDVAGFSGNHIPPRLYIRWAQFSTFCGLFMNGGHGERALWKRSKAELEIIRKFSWLHTELVPYMYHYVVTANKGGRVLQKPIEGKYQYLFGEDLLIAPIYEDALEREVVLPAGKWRYWFNDQELITGPAKLKKKFPLDEFPVFVKEGAIIPMHISRAYTNIGDTNSTNFTTWVIYPSGKIEFTIYDTQTQSPTTLHVAAQPGQITLQLTGQPIPSIFNIYADKKPVKISSGTQVLVEGVDYQYDVKKKRIVVKTGGGNMGRMVLGF